MLHYGILNVCIDFIEDELETKGIRSRARTLEKSLVLHVLIIITCVSFGDSPNLFSRLRRCNTSTREKSDLTKTRRRLQQEHRNNKLFNELNNASARALKKYFYSTYFFYVLCKTDVK